MNNTQVRLGIIATIILALVALADYPIVGQLAIGAYALVAFWKLKSSQVLKVAMITLGVVLVAIMLGQDQIEVTFADYTFLLLMIGIFVLSRELWHYSRRLWQQREEVPRN